MSSVTIPIVTNKPARIRIGAVGQPVTASCVVLPGVLGPPFGSVPPVMPVPVEVDGPDGWVWVTRLVGTVVVVAFGPDGTVVEPVPGVVVVGPT